MQLIIKASKECLKNKLAKVDVNVPEEEFFARLNWLKENEIIDELELNELKREYSTKKLIS